MAGGIESVAVHALQGAAEHILGASLAVIGRDVDDIHTEIEGGVNGADPLRFIDRAERAAKGRRAETELRDR